ncbi:Armadillo-type fold [Pseudocohnilembus persalinus]|uniref:Armadillo-type fold n=1 Tax=Pseudocohnilembus persalinus TaxID=266149 RepID=A0A0V0QSB7_PSEPJ|nr:Armadillo-type fold [Pseudocohnilembus persalinus]|eukprot:KRX04789.1 Armadillo-type fold [Pseudocohnilembus persalinus]
MKIELDFEVFKWLQQRNIFTHHNQNQNKKNQQNQQQQYYLQNNGKVEIDDQTSKQFENGVKVAQLIQELSVEIPQTTALPPLNLDKLKDSSNPAARVYNWNLIQNSMNIIGIPADLDLKQLIVSGDREMINEFIKDIQQKFDKILLRSELMSQENSRISNAAALLSNGNKYLAHVLIKGVKNQFEPVQAFLQNVYINLQRVILFIEVSEENAIVFLQTIKPSILSKNEDTALWGCRIMSKLAFDLANIELLPIVYEWFTKEMGGFQTTILCIQRHENIIENVVGIMIQIGRYNLTDLFTVQMRKILKEQDEFIRYAYLILPQLSESKISKDEMLTGGILDFWMEQAIKCSDKTFNSQENNIDQRILGLQLLVDIWKYYPIFVEETVDASEIILDKLKRGTRDSNQILKYQAINLLFKLLDYLAQDRNPYAAIIYKKLTFSLIENHQNLEDREYILQNFSNIFKKFISIPVEILVEPLIKQIQFQEGQSYMINICDIQFFTLVSQHPKAKLKLSILLVDLLCKIYLNDLIFAPSVIQPIKNIFSRYIEQQAMQEYTLKFVKICLAMLYTSAKNVKSNKPLYQNFEGDFDEHEILHKQKRALIVQILKMIILLKHTQLNEQIKPLIVHVYIQLQSIERLNKGVITLLNLFGNHIDIIREIQEQAQQQQELEKSYQDSQAPFDENEQQIANDNQQVDRNENPNYLRQSLIMQEEDFDKNIESQHNSRINRSSSQSRSQQSRRSNNQSVNESENDYFFEKYKQKSEAERRNRQKLLEIKQKRELEQQKRQQELEKKKKYKELMQKKAYEEIQKRNIQLGVANQPLNINQYNLKPTKQQIQEENQQQEVQLIYEEGTVQDHQIEEEDDENNIQILYFDLSQEEKRDQDSLKILYKKYQKAFTFLFNKYNNMTGLSMKNTTFEAHDQKSQTISHSDLWRLCKDYQIFQKFGISKKYVQNAVKKINQMNLSYRFLNGLNYDNFLTFILNLSIKCFAVIENLKVLPVGAYLEEFLKHIIVESQLKGESYAIFQDPELTGLKQQDKQTIIQFNQQLAQNPDLEVPENYKKYTEKVQQHQFVYGNKIKKSIGQKWTICSEILNDIIYKTFQISTMEAYCQIGQVQKVKIKQLLPQTSKMLPPRQKYIQNGNNPLNQNKYQQEQFNLLQQQQQQQQLKKQNSQNSLNRLDSSNNLNNQNQTNSQRASSRERGNRFSQQQSQQQIQNEGTNLSFQEQQQKSQQLQQYVTNHNQYQSKDKSPIMNKAMIQKIQQQEEERKKRQSQDKKYKDRQQELKKKMEQLQADKREKELKKKEEELAKKLEQEEREKRKRELEQKRHQEQKKKLKEYQEQQEKEKIRLQQEEEYRQREIEEKKKNEVQNFIKQQKEKLTEQFENQKAQKHQNEEMENKIKNQNLEKEKLRQQKIDEQINKEKLKRDQELELKQHLELIQNRPDILGVYEKYQKPLKTIFDHYVEYNDFKLSKGVDKQHIQMRGVVAFCQQCNIYPNIMSLDEVQNIFKIILKESDRPNQGINYQEFLQFLSRIAVKGCPGLNKIDQEINQNQIGQLDINKLKLMYQAAKNSQSLEQRNNNLNNNVETMLMHVSQTDENTIEGLIKYINYPLEKNELFQKLRELKSEKQSQNK